MAEFWSNSDRGYRLILTIEQLSQDVVANTSEIMVKLDLLNTTTTFIQYNCSAYVDFNGQRLNWIGSPSMLSYNMTINLIERNVTISHNQDG